MPKNKKRVIQISSKFIVKMVLISAMIIVAISSFSSMIPFLSRQPFLAKIVLIMALFVAYDSITWIWTEIVNN